MHPIEKKGAHAVFDIGGFFTSFTFSVGLNDDVTESLSDVVFHVLGDDKPLWHSQPMNQNLVPAGGLERVTVSVTNVRKLTLRVSSAEIVDTSHTVWVDPMVRSKVTARVYPVR